MASLNDVLSGEVCTEQLTPLTTLFTNASSINDLVTQAALLDTAPNTVTSGALGVTTAVTFISTTGAQAYTLANGTFEGQRKIIRQTVNGGGTDVGTITPATVTGFTTITMNAVDECVELEWHATGGWRVVFVSGATLP